MTTWNARALLCADPRLARRKEKFLVLLLKDITMVEETRSRAALDLAAQQFATTHATYACPRRGWHDDIHTTSYAVLARRPAVLER